MWAAYTKSARPSRSHKISTAVILCSIARYTTPHTGITYPNFPVFEAVQSKTDLLDDFEVGEQVIITFDVRGRESQNGTFYNTLRIREISRYPIGGARMDADTNGYD